MSEANNIINIYIDGSCINNGNPNAQAGYGVYFKKDDERNEYARVIGKQSNNTGELTALIRAIEIVYDKLNIQSSTIKINIYTDSEYVIKSPCPIDGSKILDGLFKINSNTFSLSSLWVVKYCPNLCFVVIGCI